MVAKKEILKAEIESPLVIYTESLLYRMGLTKGARFQAARRHQRRAAASIGAVIALSMYVFVTSTILAIYNLDEFGLLRQHLIIANIIMSAFIIAFSVLEQGKKHDLKAELFLRCAQGIQELRDALEFDLKIGKLTDERVSACVKRYNELVHDFADNHTETDFRTFRINIGKHKDSNVYAWYHIAKYWFDCWSIMWFAVLVPPLLFAIALQRAL